MPRPGNTAERQVMIATIRAGLFDVKAGRTKPARSALNVIAKEHGIKKKRK